MDVFYDKFTEDRNNNNKNKNNLLRSDSTDFQNAYVTKASIIKCIIRYITVLTTDIINR